MSDPSAPIPRQSGPRVTRRLEWVDYQDGVLLSTEPFEITDAPHLRESDPDLWGRMPAGERAAYNLGRVDATRREAGGR